MSKLSLLSAITTQSSGSNGSNSTVTQESYNKSKAEAPKRKKSKRKKGVPDGKTAAMEAVDEEIQLEAAVPNEKVDVFAFLVKEEDDAEDGQPRLDNSGSDMPVFDDDHDQEPSPQSIHSDSGISVDDGSYHLGAATLKPLLPALPEEQRSMASSDASNLLKSDWQWPDVPKPTPLTITPPHLNEASPPSFLDIRRDSGQYIADPYPACYTPATPESTWTPPSAFYDLLASYSPAEGQDLHSLPLKRFKAADTRVLLRLQQEIYQLERELKQLDTAIGAAHSPEASADSSRRPSWQWNRPHMYSARDDVLHRLQLRLETYYNQVILSRKVEQVSQRSRPTPGEAQQVHHMLKGEYTEGLSVLLDIFDDEEDLFTLGSRVEEGSENSCYLPAIAVLLTSIIPLLLFKLSTSMLNRALVISATLVLGFSAIEKLHDLAGLVGPPPRHNQDHGRKELKRWLLVGSAISTVMALIG